MKYKKLKGIELEASQIIQGTIMLSPDHQEYSSQLMDDVLSLGINCFDTACAYNRGNAEAALGNWIESRGIRDKVIIISKCAHPSDWRKRVYPCDIYADCLDSLTRLKVDCIDMYLLHRDDPSLPVGSIIEAMNRLHEEGKVNQIGVSNWTAQRIEEANEYAYRFGLLPFSASSPNYTLAEEIQPMWGEGSVSLTNKIYSGDVEWYKKTQMPVFAYSSLGRGWFSGLFSRNTFEQFKEEIDYFALVAYEDECNFKRLDRCEELAAAKGCKVPQIAMAYVLSDPEMNIFALLGARKKEEMEECIAASEICLTAEERKYLNLEI